MSEIEISIPRLLSACANSTMPVLSETLINARRIVDRERFSIVFECSLLGECGGDLCNQFVMTRI